MEKHTLDRLSQDIQVKWGTVTKTLKLNKTSLSKKNKMKFKFQLMTK